MMYITKGINKRTSKHSTPKPAKGVKSAGRITQVKRQGFRSEAAQTNLVRARAIRSLTAITFILALLVIFSSMFAPIAYAQESGVPNLTISDIEQSAGEAHGENIDASRHTMFGLLGKFANEPFTASTETDSVMGALFLTFNVVLFTVGIAFMTYSIVMAIAVSAHEGEVMGRRMSSLWVPIRYGVGVFGMIPAFHGFSLAQAVMMFIAILGIGLANMLTTTAINVQSEYSPLNYQPITAQYDHLQRVDFTPEVAEHMFNMFICGYAHNTVWYDPRTWGEQKVSLGHPMYIKSERVYVKNAPNCGELQIVDESDKFTRFGSGSLREDGLLFNAGFRNNAVNYAGINEVAKVALEARRESLRKLVTRVEPLAAQWFAGQINGEPVPYDAQALAEIANSIQNEETQKINAALKEVAQSETIKEAVKENMLRGGWTSIGAWFSTFAEVNAALQSAAVSSYLQIEEPFLHTSRLSEKEADILQALIREQNLAFREENTCVADLMERNPTGNCSVGQRVFLNSMHAIIGNTGGSGLINPIIATKNIGDWMLTAVGAVIGTGFLIKIFGNSTPAGKLLGMATDTVTSSVSGDDGSFISMSFLSTLFSITFILGIIFAVYIPFVPYLTWFSALVSYFASVLEGLIAAQVWAFSHLQTEGEGMGPKTERGYLFILNMLLRPGLMVMGFFIAASILTLVGTLFFTSFDVALANVQGATSTGPLIMLGLMVIVGLVMLTLIQTVFNLIYEIPDRVIAWFGGGMEARMAQSMDQGIERGAKLAANWMGGTALGSMMQGRGQ